MKAKHLLLSLVLCLTMPLGALAQPSAGTYYFYNVGADRYLNYGGSENYTACFKPHGEPLVLAASGSGFTVQTALDSRYLSATATSENARQSTGTVFTFTEQTDGTYVISSSAGYMGYGGTLASTQAGTVVQMNLSDATSDNARWQLLTKADLEARLSAASTTNPVDATFFVTCPNFDRHHANLSAWSNYTTGNNTGYLCNNAAYKFDSGTTVQQTLSNIPNGVYLLKAQAFYRYGSNGTATGYTEATMPMHGYMFAGSDEVLVKSILSSENLMSTNIYTEAGHSGGGRSFGGGYIPYGASNNYADACIAFDYGLYSGNELQTTVTDGSLTIGFKVDEHFQYSWIAYDNIELYYLGMPADLTPFREQYYALRTKINDDILSQTSVYTDEDGAETAYNAVLATQNDIVDNATTEQEIADAKTALWAAALTFMKSVTISGTGFDLTSFMVNPEVDHAEGSSTTAPGWTTTANLVFGDYHITQFSSSVPFDMHQVVANMPAGQYTVKVRGFFRPGAFSSSDMTAVANAEVPTKIYLNETEQALVNICADASSVQLTKGKETKVNGNTIYIPDSRSHLQYFYEAGHYWNEMAAVVSEDCDLTIGLKYDTWVTDGWGVISDFHLYYRGPLDLSAWQEQLALTVSAAQALEIPTLPRRQLTEVVQQNNKTYTTAEAYQTAIANINAAIAVAEPYVEPYAQYKTMRTMIQENIISQTVYTDPDDAADAYSTTLSTINSAVEDINSVEALETQKTNLWNAALTFMKGVSINDGQGFDLTWMIGDADFSDANYKNYWTEECTSSSAHGYTSGVLRYYNSPFDVYQTLPYTLPAGAFKMTVDGFERNGDPMNTAWATYQSQGNTATGTLYLNNNEQVIMDLFDYQDKTDSGWSGSKPEGASFYVPNESSAANTYLSNGVYPNTLIGVLSADGDVTLGYRCANTVAWTCVDNFKLWYIGEVPQVALNVTAGELTPLYVPFTLDVSDADVAELYAVGGVHEGSAKLYAVNTVPAGTPCVAKFNTSSYSAPMEISLSGSKKFVLPWYDAILESDIDHYTWKYSDATSNQVPISDFNVLGYDNMQFEVNLENYAARQYLSKVEYSGSSDASEVAQYNVAPPTRRDIPNAVMIPVPSFEGDPVTVTVKDGDSNVVATVTLTEGETQAYVYNLLPQQNYTFETSNSSAQGSFHTAGHLRMVYAPSAYNIRDLGGWETQDGHRTTYGHLFRGSTLNGYVSCTAEDLQTLRDLGVGGEIDLRWNESYDKDMGCGTSAFGFTGDDYYFAAANDYTAANLSEAATQARLKQEFDFILSHFRQGKGVYFHCAWGADRTGMLSFLLEGVLGLTLDQIYKNYELTSFSAAPGNTNRVKTSFQDRIDVIQALSGATLRDKFENYFVNSLGISMDDITYFRSVMLEGYPFTIDEDAAVPAYFAGEADVTLHRTLKKDMHNTVVFPFNLPRSKAKYFFGEDVKMERIIAYNETLQTETIDEAPAHTPFLLIPSAVREDNTYLLDAVTMVEGELSDAEFTNGKMVGTYGGITVGRSEVEGKENYVISNDKFYLVNTTSAPMKSTRAYLVLDMPAGGNAKSIVTFDGEATGINSMNNEQLTIHNDEVYDLQGRRISQHSTLNTQLPKGMYIVNGKKVFVK